MRDAQRQKLYDAEQAVRRSLDRGASDGTAPTLERKWGDLRDIQDFVNTVCDGLAMARVEVVPRSSNHRFSSMDRRHQQMNLILSWGSRETVVLHELAHYTTYAGLPAHGPHFAQEFIDLLDRFSLGGTATAEKMTAQFDKAGVAHGRRAANEMACRELRNITNGIRGTGAAHLIFEAPMETFSDIWITTSELRHGAPVDSDHLVAIGIHR